MAFGRGKTFVKGLDLLSGGRMAAMALRMMLGMNPNGKAVTLPAGQPARRAKKVPQPRRKRQKKTKKDKIRAPPPNVTNLDVL